MCVFAAININVINSTEIHYFQVHEHNRLVRKSSMLMRSDKPPVIEVIDIDIGSSPFDKAGPVDWTDKCVYECYLCADGQTQTTAASSCPCPDMSGLPPAALTIDK